MIILRHKSGHSIGIDVLYLSNSFEVYSLDGNNKIDYTYTSFYTLGYLFENGYRII